MKCPHCNWQNPATYTHCFNCNAPLMAEAAPASSGRFERRQHPQPGHAATAPAHEPSTLAMAEPDALKRVAATIIDALLLGVALIAIAAAGLFALQSPALASAGLTAVALIVVLALLLPFGVLGGLDATGGTPGKRLLQLRVIRGPGQAPGVLRASLRQLAKYGFNLALPFVFHLIDRVLFGRQGAHNVLTGTHVVDRRAAATAVQRFVAEQATGRIRARLACGLLVGLGAFALAVLALLTVGWAQSTLRDRADPQGAAVRDELETLVRGARPVTRLAQDHHARTQAFAPDVAALGLGALPEGVDRIEANPRNGALTATLNAQLAQGRLAGRHIVWVPEFRTRKGDTQLRRWRCGSADNDPAWLPATCKDDVRLLQAPGS